LCARKQGTKTKIAKTQFRKNKEQGMGQAAISIGTISRKTSDSTDKSNGQNLLDIAVTNALELPGDWLIPGFSRPTAEKERRAGGGSGFLGFWVGGPKTSARPPVSSPIGPRAPNPRGPSQVVED
jgi:hypothetical protein